MSVAKRRQIKSLHRVRDVIVPKHQSIRTEGAYVPCIRRYVLFHGKHHSNGIGADEIEEYLTYLTVGRNAAAST